jgi:hypothetical protein
MNCDLGKDLPGIIINKSGPCGASSIDYQDSDKRHFSFDQKTTKVYFPWGEMRQGEALFHLAYPLLELQHQNNGAATIHSACISLNGIGVLLLGGEGAGKTSTMLALCRGYKAQLFSNDLTILKKERKKIYAIAGTRSINLRYESLRKTHSDLLCHLPNQGLDTWATKAPIEANKLGIGECFDPLEIKCIYQLHIDNNQKSLHFRPFNSISAMLGLNEELSRFVRGTAKAFIVGDSNEFGGYVPSLDNNKLFKKRVELINLMKNEVGITYLSGPLDKVVDYIIANSS